ncbi:hypothetical protein EX30DRAFT_351030 [Ascodesmis nigricans]|uniref:Uncharacterized protein n=1 Tax=Ascodesmis nigricans TaxID=341454 RepID=A0A4S2MN99_9PEZI|nr:hypothetical protein EX30DRAFT_351030 [Ascodesmis nigricans]
MAPVNPKGNRYSIRFFPAERRDESQDPSFGFQQAVTTVPGNPKNKKQANRLGELVPGAWHDEEESQVPSSGPQPKWKIPFTPHPPHQVDPEKSRTSRDRSANIIEEYWYELTGARDESHEARLSVSNPAESSMAESTKQGQRTESLRPPRNPWSSSRKGIIEKHLLRQEIKNAVDERRRQRKERDEKKIKKSKTENSDDDWVIVPREDSNRLGKVKKPGM